MADIREKDGLAENVTSPAVSEHDQHVYKPTGWKYRDVRVLGLRIPHYASPQIQLLMVALVCFLCPGMFNALSGLGGGGQIDRYAANASNTALYATFSVVGFFAGTFTNYLGIKPALAFGGIGYSVYVAAFLCWNHVSNFGFIVFAGALLGVCAGLLWSAQGAIMLSYPPEQYKGRYIAAFWAIFNTGAVIGSLIPLGQNINVTTNSAVSDGTYVGFLVLTFCGALLALFLVSVKSVLRDDGSRVILMKHPTFISEVVGIYKALLNEPFVLLFVPMWFASNWFYTYQFNDVNLAQFNTRTRALNNVLYWTAQIFGSGLFGFFLDTRYLRRTTRAKIGWAALFVITMVIWGGGYDFQKGYTREETTADGYMKMDWTTPGYVGPMFLYIFYGVYDAAWQTTIYWFMGALSNNSRVLCFYASMYKGIQSAGAAVIWRLDGLQVGAPSFMSLFISSWVLLAGALVVALPVVWFRIKDTTTLEEDLKLSDETVEEVTGQRPLDAPATGEKV